MTLSMLLLKSLCALCSLCLVYSSKDDSYYPYGRVNPNTKHPMYWHDASNILQDLDQFSELYVQFHSCAWSPLDFNEQQQEQGENMDENDYWYMNAMPQSGPNIAFSLYGSLKKGRNFSGCNKRTYINSFYTTAGFSVFADTLASVGMSNAGTQYSSTCSNNAQLACHDNSKSSSFVLLNYNGDCGSSRVKSKTIPSELAAFNSMLANEAQCAKIYSSSDSAAPTLLQYSRSCSLNDYVGACPDPYGRRSAIEHGFFELTTLTTYYEQSMQGFLLLGAGAVVWISAGALVYFEYHKTRGSNKNTVFELPRLGRIKKENGSDDGTMSASSSDDSRRNVDDAYQRMDADANDDTSANSDGYEIIKEPLSDAVSIKSRMIVKSRDDPINDHTVENAEQAGQRRLATGTSLPRNKCVNQKPWKILNAATMDLTNTDVASVLTHSEKALSLKSDSDDCADGTIEMLLRRELDVSTNDATRGIVPLANLYGIHQSCSEHDSSSSYSSSSSKSNDDWSEVSEPVCVESLCAEDASSVSSLATSRTPSRPDLKSDNWYGSTDAIKTSLAIVNVSASYVSGVIGRVLLQTEPEVAAEETIINLHDADRSMDRVDFSDKESSMVVAHNPSDESSRNVMEGVRTSRSESSTSTHISIDSGDGVCICSLTSAGNVKSGIGENGVDKLVCRKVSADIGSPARLILTADSSGDMTNRTTAAMPEPSPLERSIRLVNGDAGSIMLQFTSMHDTVETMIAESRASVDLDAGQTLTESNEAGLKAVSSTATTNCGRLKSESLMLDSIASAHRTSGRHSTPNVDSFGFPLDLPPIERLNPVVDKITERKSQNSSRCIDLSASVADVRGEWRTVKEGVSDNERFERNDAASGVSKQTKKDSLDDIAVESLSRNFLRCVPFFLSSKDAPGIETLPALTVNDEGSKLRAATSRRIEKGKHMVHQPAPSYDYQDMDGAVEQQPNDTVVRKLDRSLDRRRNRHRRKVNLLSKWRDNDDPSALV